MVALTTEEVKHVAKLAKLKLSDSEVKKFSKELSKIIDFVSELKKVNVEGIKPLAQTTGLTNVKREDKTSSDDVLTVNEALSGSDKTYNNYFKVPALLEGRTDK